MKFLLLFLALLPALSPAAPVIHNYLQGHTLNDSTGTAGPLHMVGNVPWNASQKAWGPFSDTDYLEFPALVASQISQGITLTVECDIRYFSVTNEEPQIYEVSDNSSNDSTGAYPDQVQNWFLAYRSNASDTEFSKYFVTTFPAKKWFHWKEVSIQGSDLRQNVVCCPNLTPTATPHVTPDGPRPDNWGAIGYYGGGGFPMDCGYIKNFTIRIEAPITPLPTWTQTPTPSDTPTPVPPTPTPTPTLGL